MYGRIWMPMHVLERRCSCRRIQRYFQSNDVRERHNEIHSSTIIGEKWHGFVDHGDTHNYVCDVHLIEYLSRCLWIITMLSPPLHEEKVDKPLILCQKVAAFGCICHIQYPNNIMSNPKDKTLYEKIRQTVNRKYPTHSAYRSGILVQRYKAAFKKKHGARKSPYTGTFKSSGLTRWFREKWRNQNGKIGYKNKGDIYRPTRRISKKTPLTFDELSQKRLRRATRTKRAKGRVGRF